MPNSPETAFAHLGGWLGPDRARREISRLQAFFSPYVLRGQSAERKRTVLWEICRDGGIQYQWEKQVQQIGDCVSFGSTNAKMATAIYEIVRLKQPELFKPLFQPYAYGASRMAPEAGGGRLGKSDGSLVSWCVAAQKYGDLRADYEGVPKYSGAVASAWGSSMAWKQFGTEAGQHTFQTAALIHSADELVEAICNGYFPTIGGNRPYPDKLVERAGKMWYPPGGQRVGHCTSFLGYDPDPEPCVYEKNQWPSSHASGQTDGWNGGGWRKLSDVERDIQNGAEVAIFSAFDGFPAPNERPDFSMY